MCVVNSMTVLSQSLPLLSLSLCLSVSLSLSVSSITSCYNIFVCRRDAAPYWSCILCLQCYVDVILTSNKVTT